MMKWVMAFFALAFFAASASAAQTTAKDSFQRGNIKLINLQVEETGEKFDTMEQLYDNLIANQVISKSIQRDKLETVEEFNERRGKYLRTWENDYVGNTFKVKMKLDLASVLVAMKDTNDCILHIYPYTDPYDARKKSVTFEVPGAVVKEFNKKYFRDAAMSKSGEFAVNCLSDVRTVRDELLPYKGNIYMEFDFVIKAYDQPTWVLGLKNFKVYLDSTRNRDAKEMKYEELVSVTQEAEAGDLKASAP